MYKGEHVCFLALKCCVMVTLDYIATKSIFTAERENKCATNCNIPTIIDNIISFKN